VQKKCLLDLDHNHDIDAIYSYCGFIKDLKLQNLLVNQESKALYVLEHGFDMSQYLSSKGFINGDFKELLNKPHTTLSS
jgi:hypothetical protein